jgi:hypothetical protein
MKPSALEAPSQPAGTFLLPMRDIAHMFNSPPVDPLSPSPPEVLGLSGTRYLLQQLETRRRVKTETLKLVLPRAKVTPGLAEQTRQGLQRYAEYRIQEEQALARETRRNGWRMTLAAFVLLAFFLGLSYLFASELTEGMRPLLRKTLEYGFEIVGWVMLWHPIDVLVFEPIAIQHKIAALRRLLQLHVVVEAGDAVLSNRQ